jgi:general secretion pathway protein L
VVEYLFIRSSRLSDEDDAQDAPASTEWAVLDADGRLLSVPERGSLEAARAAAGNRRTVLLVPGPDVISTQAMLPAASQARLRKMLPYSLEDALAEDVEELLFAVGPRLGSGAVSVSVVARRSLDLWLDALRGADITPFAVYSDAEGVPDTPSTLTLVIEGERIYGRRPDQPPFAFEGLGVAQVLDVLRGAATHEEPPHPDPSARGDTALGHLLVYIDQAGQSRYAAELDLLRGKLASCDVKLMAGGALPRLAATLVHRPGTNLLQGSYAPKSNWGVLIRPWRMAAGLAVGAVVLALLAQAAGYIALRRADATLTQRVAASCEQLVSSTQLSACESEVQRRLASVGGATAASSETFLTTLVSIAQSRNPETRIEALSYRNGIMDLQLVAPDVPTLDEFARQIDQTARFDVRIESSNQTDSGVEGRIQIAATAP